LQVVIFCRLSTLIYSIDLGSQNSFLAKNSINVGFLKIGAAGFGQADWMTGNRTVVAIPPEWKAGGRQNGVPSPDGFGILTFHRKLSLRSGEMGQPLATSATVVAKISRT
jgi:hypothetical protein